jgi:hypothetical protein
MKKLPIGPIVIGMVIIGLIGGVALMPAKKPAPPALTIVSAPSPDGTARSASSSPSVVPTPPPQAETSDSGRDPPARREPGAINYADKGVLPAI